MNISKIFKTVVGIGAVSSVAYLAYKVGEVNGEINRPILKPQSVC